MNSAGLMLRTPQGSDAWQRARLGIPTASNFKRIITPSGVRSNAAPGYLAELLQEWRSGEVTPTPNSPWIARGIELEPAARNYYAGVTGRRVTQVGLVYRDRTKLIAASPDGLVGDDGLLEIKCPMNTNHRKYVSHNCLPKPYIPQIQGQLWVTGRAWCDFLSYHPDFSRQLVVRVLPDSAYIARLAAAVLDFVAELVAAREKSSTHDKPYDKPRNFES